MKETRDLFGEAYSRNTDPKTSKSAAKKMIDSGMATRREKQVCNAIWYPENELDGLTCGEICIITGLQWNTASPRLAPLRRKGFIQIRTDAFGEVTRLDPITKTAQLVHERGQRKPEWDIYEDI